ncbi:MAG: hypothetical protein ACLGIV_06905 [Actinomycetes bacterium]
MNAEATPQDRDVPIDDQADAAVMGLLSEKVPLSLLMDLSAPAGPDSEAILDEEGEPEEAWWEQP